MNDPKHRDKHLQWQSSAEYRVTTFHLFIFIKISIQEQCFPPLPAFADNRQNELLAWFMLRNLIYNVCGVPVEKSSIALLWISPPYPAYQFTHLVGPYSDVPLGTTPLVDPKENRYATCVVLGFIDDSSRSLLCMDLYRVCSTSLRHCRLQMWGKVYKIQLQENIQLSALQWDYIWYRCSLNWLLSGLEDKKWYKLPFVPPHCYFPSILQPKPTKIASIISTNYTALYEWLLGKHTQSILRHAQESICRWQSFLSITLVRPVIHFHNDDGYYDIRINCAHPRARPIYGIIASLARHHWFHSVVYHNRTAMVYNVVFAVVQRFLSHANGSYNVAKHPRYIYTLIHSVCRVSFCNSAAIGRQLGKLNCQKIFSVV